MHARTPPTGAFDPANLAREGGQISKMRVRVLPDETAQIGDHVSVDWKTAQWIDTPFGVRVSAVVDRDGLVVPAVAGDASP
jgi:hypothetical protein